LRILLLPDDGWYYDQFINENKERLKTIQLIQNIFPIEHFVDFYAKNIVFLVCVLFIKPFFFNIF
jgi:hypothetical protein